MRLPRKLDRQLGFYIWGCILIAVAWPLVIPLAIIWGAYKALSLIISSWCSSCSRPFSMYKAKSIVIKSYWEKACLDGSPDLRYKRNVKHYELRETWVCKRCALTKVKEVSRVDSY